jgi:hypothetical protein
MLVRILDAAIYNTETGEVISYYPAFDRNPDLLDWGRINPTTNTRDTMRGAIAREAWVKICNVAQQQENDLFDK